MKKKPLLLLPGMFFVAMFLFPACDKQITIHPEQLRCENLTDPTVVDVLQPRLSWINIGTSGIRGQEQKAWQIRVASSIENLDNPDLWDSGKKKSDQSTRVVYQGNALTSRQECFWQVRVWDQNGAVSEWSEPGKWRMGLLNQEDWQALWIGAPWQGEEALPTPSRRGGQETVMDFGPPAPLLRKPFTLEKEIASAHVYVTGLGYFELYLNGAKVGDDVLIPNQTNYGKRPGLPNKGIPLPDDFRDYKVMYMAYDVTDRLKKGENVIGGILGNGFYNPAMHWAEAYGSPRFLCQLQLSYADGSEEVVVSDESWKVSRSPILMNMVYYGEDYDARLEQPDWCTEQFDDSEWEQVVLRKAPEGRLVAHTAHPDKVTQRLEPVSIEKLGEGHYFVDFGVEISGWVRLNDVEGPEGQEIHMEFNGNLYSGENCSPGTSRQKL